MSTFFTVVILVIISYLAQVETRFQKLKENQIIKNSDNSLKENSVKEFPERVDLKQLEASIIKDNKSNRNKCNRKYRSANSAGMMIIGGLIPINCAPTSVRKGIKTNTKITPSQSIPRRININGAATSQPLPYKILYSEDNESSNLEAEVPNDNQSLHQYLHDPNTQSYVLYSENNESSNLEEDIPNDNQSLPHPNAQSYVSDSEVNESPNLEEEIPNYNQSLPHPNAQSYVPDSEVNESPNLEEEILNYNQSLPHPNAQSYVPDSEGNESSNLEEEISNYNQSLPRPNAQSYVPDSEGNESSNLEEEIPNYNQSLPHPNTQSYVLYSENNESSNLEEEIPNDIKTLSNPRTQTTRVVATFEPPWRNPILHDYIKMMEEQIKKLNM